MNHPQARRILIEDLYDEGFRVLIKQTGVDVTAEIIHYRDYLLANGGNTMRRALIKAEDRYTSLKPPIIAARRARRGYPARWRRPKE